MVRFWPWCVFTNEIGMIFKIEIIEIGRVCTAHCRRINESINEKRRWNFQFDFVKSVNWATEEKQSKFWSEIFWKGVSSVTKIIQKSQNGIFSILLKTLGTHRLFYIRWDILIKLLKVKRNVIRRTKIILHGMLIFLEDLQQWCTKIFNQAIRKKD